MKHIAIVVPEFPTASETFVVTEICALAKAGHQVTVFCFIKRDSVVTLPNNVTVIDVNMASNKQVSAFVAKHPLATTKAFKCANHQHAITTCSLLSYGAKLAYLADKFHCEHFHCHFMHCSLAYTLVAACWLEITTSSVEHGSVIYEDNDDIRYKLTACSFNIAECEDIIKNFQLLGAKHLHLLHSGVDISRFPAHPVPSHKQLELLFVGHLVEKKGIAYALEALALIAENVRPHFDIVGQGPAQNYLQHLVKKLNLTAFVRLMGYRSPHWIAQKGSDYDGFVAPFCVSADGDSDSGPVVLKEAMAMGLPVITSDVMGCRDIVTEDTGYIVASKDVLALKLAIEALIQCQNNVRDQMRLLARQRVEQYFNAQVQALRLSRLIEGATVK
ncbi:glycosyltransferase [Moritella sp. F3]|uniref:glycosyltransferase n=1 Tax=Moritella sp. F3 TaxID=2718882 RepID=UPI0018E1A2F9|nr:glycosyltransferase [Moritella sp. F3]GIC75700.1 colanic acid biosynthesis glycosyltransferase WcaL [Moritella sp. F1]GIC81852.1 colanic acid biosynthesis glycosyltransferase WcaL [Moritella sp. F3]